jgi:hypothetical protein
MPFLRRSSIRAGVHKPDNAFHKASWRFDVGLPQSAGMSSYDRMILDGVDSVGRGQAGYKTSYSAHLYCECHEVTCNRKFVCPRTGSEGST